ncbi:hypothetical protein KL918_001579 [Ogataea parapolymorpha]|uniref:Uncharacterized protein n=1 Tax=Ogataea parapolymorpha (strain ATCC 26012 / BCRC 20466 / JCM 22074 / NRRL Y-7560 / DL-1) TaxID=871575 RepID=W1QER9_OGAPD|nr:hypothetical protein HPODL_03375 [Ogataea parapolymorpha DL-1]ESW99486.1 hypothetical protein HPODL_03375 [Ogataea parapolymorpha DL-1]KAG7868936.1 hypothetical protein KL918_001579 [Ogataea parapolymorpha]KAG7874017.1 hypothetical protein KL916_001791 [Ogataea parapolymorpha]
MEDEFDDFGEFEEFEQPPQQSGADTFIFAPENGSVEELSHMIHSLLGSDPSSEPAGDLQLDQRCQDVYERLTLPPMNLQQVNWKRSLLRRQLLLSLRIPIDLDEVLPSGSKTRKSKLYDSNALAGLKNNELSQLEERIAKLEIDKVEKDKILESSAAVLESVHQKVQPESFYRAAAERGELDSKANELESVRDELLKIACSLNLRLEELKQDNEIYSMYVENLVGNTQKRRREEKKGDRK